MQSEYSIGIMVVLGQSDILVCVDTQIVTRRHVSESTLLSPA